MAGCGPWLLAIAVTTSPRKPKATSTSGSSHSYGTTCLARSAPTRRACGARTWGSQGCQATQPRIGGNSWRLLLVPAWARSPCPSGGTVCACLRASFFLALSSGCWPAARACRAKKTPVQYRLGMPAGVAQEERQRSQGPSLLRPLEQGRARKGARAPLAGQARRTRAPGARLGLSVATPPVVQPLKRASYATRRPRQRASMLRRLQTRLLTTSAVDPKRQVP